VYVAAASLRRARLALSGTSAPLQVAQKEVEDAQTAVLKVLNGTEKATLTTALGVLNIANNTLTTAGKAANAVLGEIGEAFGEIGKALSSVRDSATFMQFDYLNFYLFLNKAQVGLGINFKAAFFGKSVRASFNLAIENPITALVDKFKENVLSGIKEKFPKLAKFID
jgi:hypothetical protein